MLQTLFYALGPLFVVFPKVMSSSHGLSNHGLERHRHQRWVNKHPTIQASLEDHPNWIITDCFRGKDFYKEFTFEAIPDPTLGRVNYVDMNTAIKLGLTEAKHDSFIMRTDNTTILDPKGPGRASLRIQSKKKWTTGVTVLDLKHLPEGCGTWPAFWMTQTKGWPTNGEIDVIEGVNDQPPNFSALHTLNGCSMGPERPMTGSVVSANCSYLNNWNQGCPVKWDRLDAFGPALNAMGGGWYVVERTNYAISIWFWGRNDKHVPPAVRYGSPVISTKTFGVPVAFWSTSDTCDFSKIFGPLNIIINLTFCGVWAEQAPIFNGAAGCPGTCVDYVNNNPSSFKTAYWDITSLRVYSRAM